MNLQAVQRQLRQIALPEIGPDGQERLAVAVVAVAGDDRIAEVAARYLAAAGIGTLRLIGATVGADSDAHDDAHAAAYVPSLRQSNPDLVVEQTRWPADGLAWIAALAGVDLVLRSGFDDDAMLRAAVRRGTPAVIARAVGEKAELISFRRQGPCPHAALDVAPRAATRSSGGAPAVVAGTLAAAEAIVTLTGEAQPPESRPTAPAAKHARHLSLPIDGGEPRAQEIPWSPECFTCGGTAMEMAFS